MMDKELRLKIGQMLMAGFPSPEVDTQAKRLIEDFYVGNFALFARNIVNARQISGLCSALSELVWQKTGYAPMLEVDQEGGVVCRLTEGAALLPGPMAIAAAKADARVIGKNCADTLLSVGINSNTAPVLDVNRDAMNPIIGARSFGDTVEAAERYGLGLMNGMRERGMIASVKHFPGHGNVKTDSHLAMPCNDADEKELREIDFAPFQSAFAMGADALMTSHVCFKNYDSKYPATLSHRIMTDLLRGEMGFEGVAISDCMEMGAIRTTYGTGEGAVLAVEAGCDILCFSHTYEAVAEAASALYAAVDSGRISPARIEQSYARIVRLKKKYHLLDVWHPDIEAARAVLYDPVRLEQHRSVSRKSITLVSDEGGIECLKSAKRPAFFAPESLALTGNEDEPKQPTNFSRMAAERFGGTGTVLQLNALDDASRAALLSPDYDVAVLGLYNARFREGQQQILRLLEAQPRPLVVVLLGAPYDAALVQRADAVIAAYEYTPMSVRAALDAIAENEFPGTLPVTLQPIQP